MARLGQPADGQVSRARVLPAANDVDKPPDLRRRSFQLAVAVIRLTRTTLPRDPILRSLAFQLVSAAGSVAANLAEGQGGQSKRDFIAKNAIALKEALETRLWLRLIAAAEPPMAKEVDPLLEECSEIVAMLVATLKTARRNMAAEATTTRRSAGGGQQR